MCVCVCVTENHLGKVAATASLLLPWKMWKHPSPPPSLLPPTLLTVDEAMDSLFSGILFFFFTLVLLIFVVSIKMSLTPAPLAQSHKLSGFVNGSG